MHFNWVQIEFLSVDYKKEHYLLHNVLQNTTKVKESNWVVGGRRRSVTPLSCRWEGGRRIGGQTLHWVVGWKRRSFTPLSCGLKEEVIHSFELWVGVGGDSLHWVVGCRMRSFMPMSYGWEEEVVHSEEEVIHSIELWVGGGGHSLGGGGHSLGGGGY